MSVARRTFLAGMAAASTAAMFRGSGVAAQAPPRKFNYTKPIYDLHVHWYPPEFGDVILKEGAAHGVTEIRQEGWNVSAKIPGHHPYGSGRASFRREDMTDIPTIVKADDDRDVGVSVMTQTNPHVQWASPELGAKLARAINDGTSALHQKHPKRFYGAMSLPMQDVKLALAELERARKLPGIRAINMTENILGKNLHQKEFWPVWEKAEQYGLPLFLKNVDPVSERLVEPDFNLMLTLGNPFEATIAATVLVAGGVMDAFPKLDVYLPHAGGFFPFVGPRLDWSMGVAEYAARRGGRTDAFKNLKQKRFSDYLRRFHYDIIHHDPKVTRMMIDIVGADRVISGTDFPQAMAVVNPRAYIEAVPGITQKEAQLILCDNAERLLKL